MEFKADPFFFAILVSVDLVVTVLAAAVSARLAVRHLTAGDGPDSCQVHALHVRDVFGRMVSAVEVEAKAYGYELQPRSNCANQELLPKILFDHLAMVCEIAKVSEERPFLDDEIVQDLALRAFNDGSAGLWLKHVLSVFDSRGVNFVGLPHSSQRIANLAAANHDVVDELPLSSKPFAPLDAEVVELVDELQRIELQD